MNIRILLASVVVLAASTAYATPTSEAETITVKVGKQFRIPLDQMATTSVNWYFLAPEGPGVKLINVETNTHPQTGVGIGGSKCTRTFIFQATKPTGMTSYALRFVLMDFSNKVYESKKVSYQVTK